MDPSFMIALALIALGIFLVVISGRLTAEVRGQWETKIGRRIDFRGFTKTKFFFQWNRIGLIVLGIGLILAGIFKLAEALLM